MNRKQWIKERRRVAEERYDNIFSLDYDEKWGNLEQNHIDNLNYFLNLLPKETRILDAACGTGKYWDIVTSKNFKVIGMDQSSNMLKKAQMKYPKISIIKGGLQEIGCSEEFWGILCIDAMENIFPEQWPLVLKNFYRALKKEGYLYFTVETISEDETKEAFKKALKLGLPVIEGEYAHEGGYHYYPAIEEVKVWIKDIGFNMIKEGVSEGYYHFIVKKV